VVKLTAITKGLKKSATLEINELVRKKYQSGEFIVNLGLGESPFPVHPAIREKLSQHTDKKSYLSVQGLSALRCKVSEFYREVMKLNFYSPDQIIVGPGSKILLYDAMNSLEGSLFLPAPSWVSYQHQAHLLGKKVHHMITSPRESYRLTPGDLERALQEHSPDLTEQKILLLNYPANPTGQSYSVDQLKELASVARDYNVVVLSDEIYGLIRFNGREHHSIAEYYPEGTIITSGVSKDRSLGGYRLGVALVPEEQKELLGALLAIGSETWSCVSAPIQYAAIEAYNSKSTRIMEYIKDCTSIHEIVAKYVYRRLIRAGISCSHPEGAFYLFPDWNVYKRNFGSKDITTSNKLCRILLNDYNVAALPGSEFGMPETDLSIRISLIDYDGGLAIKTFRENREKAINEPVGFIGSAAPMMKIACDKLEAFTGNTALLTERSLVLNESISM
jgi:aspartate/methionine/tyrosine aminotransferase